MAINLAYPFDDEDDQITRSPFAEGVVNGRYFSNERYDLNLNKLIHLAPYSELLIVTGAYGVGKTTLLEQFSHKAADTWRTALVPCVESEPDTGLLLKIIEHIEMPLVTADESKGILMDSLVCFLESLGRSGRRAFLILDDAQNLSDDQLNMLGALLGDYRVDNAISLILVAQPGINARVGRIESLHQRLKYAFEIMPLENTKAIAKYISQRLEAAGATDKLFLFTPEVIQEIASHSEGLPGRINALAKNILAEKKIAPANGGTASDTPKGGRWALISAGILSILLILLFQEDINRVVEPAHSPGEQFNLIALAEQKTLEPSPGLQELELPAAVLFEQPPLSPPPAMPNAVTNAAAIITTETVEKIPPQAIPETEAKKNKTDTAEPESVPTIEAVAPQPPTKTIVPPTPAITKTPVLSAEHKWLMAQKPTHFTLQLMALRDEKKVRDFVKKHKLSGDSAVFDIQRKTGRLAVLVYGSYSSAEKAKDAGAKLPKSWGIKRPWARPFSAVTTEFSENK